MSDVATQRTAIGVAAPAGAGDARRATPSSSPAAASGSASVPARRRRRAPRATRRSRPRRRRRRAPSRAVALRARSSASRLSADEAARLPSRSTPDSTNARHRAVEHVERVGQRGRGALGGGRRVVELVREPGRHLARARRASRAAARPPRSAPSPGGTRGSRVWNAAGVVEQQAAELGRADPRDAARLGGAHRDPRRRSPDSARIAPSQVGATCWWSRSSRPSTVSSRRSGPRAGARTATSVVAVAHEHVPALAAALLGRRRPAAERAASRPRRTGRCARSSATVTLMCRRGTGG